MRTKIVIHDALLKEAQLLTGIKTKKEVVNQALNQAAAHTRRKPLIDLKGRIKFASTYDYKPLRKFVR